MAENFSLGYKNQLKKNSNIGVEIRGRCKLRSFYGCLTSIKKKSRGSRAAKWFFGDQKNQKNFFAQEKIKLVEKKFFSPPKNNKKTFLTATNRNFNSTQFIESFGGFWRVVKK